MKKASLPIGVFDSGLGGLTVLKALKQLLPNEQFIYYGDTAHLPYGDKSEETLVKYVSVITNFLHTKQCKLVVVACNSASTVLQALNNMPFEFDQVVEVISPVASLIGTQDKYHSIGIIGTRKTIQSQIYQRSLTALNPALKIVARQTPLLVPAIEEGFTDEEFLFPLFKKYFADFENIDLLIPACTHYPMIYEQIENYFNKKVKVLHAPKVMAEYVQKLLQDKALLNNEINASPDEFHLSDITESFQNEAELFLGEKINIIQTSLD